MSDPIYYGGQSGQPGWLRITYGNALVFDAVLLHRTAEMVPDGLSDLWRDKLKASIEPKILPGWDPILDTHDHYQDKVVTPAIPKFAPFLNPNYRSKRGLLGSFSTHKYNVNLTGSYDAAVEGVDTRYNDERDEYEDKVDAGRTPYEAGEALPLP